MSLNFIPDIEKKTASFNYCYVFPQKAISYMTIDSSKICMKVHTVHEEFELDTKIMAKWERNKQNKTPKMAISKGM